MEMETSTEPLDPLTPSVAASAVQPEGGYRGHPSAQPVDLAFCCSSFNFTLHSQLFSPVNVQKREWAWEECLSLQCRGTRLVIYIPSPALFFCPLEFTLWEHVCVSGRV